VVTVIDFDQVFDPNEYWHTCLYAMSLADDFSDDKLETTIWKNPERVFHVEYTSDLAHGLKKVAVVKKWTPQRHLGAGSFGTVRLEKLDDDPGKSGRTQTSIEL
jgi:hypothetical protein